MQESGITKKSPIKRHESLKEISRDHHFGLLLCWKIKEGLKKGIEPSRIKKYCDYFFNEQLLPHFRIEELIIFPLLDTGHPLIKKALSDHEHLKSLFGENEAFAETLLDITFSLEQHIRFEERELFQELQKSVSVEKLNEIAIVHDEAKRDEWGDEFWK